VLPLMWLRLIVWSRCVAAAWPLTTAREQLGDCLHHSAIPASGAYAPAGGDLTTKNVKETQAHDGDVSRSAMVLHHLPALGINRFGAHGCRGGGRGVLGLLSCATCWKDLHARGCDSSLTDRYAIGDVVISPPTMAFVENIEFCSITSWRGLTARLTSLAQRQIRAIEKNLTQRLGRRSLNFTM